MIFSAFRVKKYTKSANGGVTTMSLKVAPGAPDLKWPPSLVSSGEVAPGGTYSFNARISGLRSESGVSPLLVPHGDSKILTSILSYNGRYRS